MKRNPFSTLCIALAFAFTGWSSTAQAQAFDPQDPYRRVFLDMMLTFASSAELSDNWSEDWDSIRAARDLREELRVCGTFYRTDLTNHLLEIMNDATVEPEVLSGIADIIRASVAFSNMDEELGKFSLEAVPDAILAREDIQELIYQMTRYFSNEDQYYGNLWFGEALVPRGLAPPILEFNFYPKAEFLVGDIQKYVIFAETAFGDDFLDWPITAAMRAGRDDLARRLQADYDRTKPTNITKLLFLETPTAQAAHCQGLLQGVRDRLMEQERFTAKAEAQTTGVRFASWTLLLCGQFADSRRSARKMGWNRMARSCGFNRETSNVTDFYNAILSGAYLATEQRKNGELLRSAFTLEEIVAEVRQVLYLDSFTGLGHINIVVDEDIELYMTHLHGMTPELRVVQGLLEEARGNTALAVDAWKKALASEELHERWIITLQAWVNGESSRISLLEVEDS